MGTVLPVPRRVVLALPYLLVFWMIEMSNYLKSAVFRPVVLKLNLIGFFYFFSWHPSVGPIRVVML